MTPEEDEALAKYLAHYDPVNNQCHKDWQQMGDKKYERTRHCNSEMVHGEDGVWMSNEASVRRDECARKAMEGFCEENGFKICEETVWDKKQEGCLPQSCTAEMINE